MRKNCAMGRLVRRATDAVGGREGVDLGTAWPSGAIGDV